MGQYYLIVNLDKKEYIKPHAFGDGAKLLEFGSSSCGTMNALALLLASGNGRGGGDLQSSNSIIGSWAGNRIVVAGDYDDPNKFLSGDDELENEGLCLYTVASGQYKNISGAIKECMCEDVYIKANLASKHF